MTRPCDGVSHARIRGARRAPRYRGGRPVACTFFSQFAWSLFHYTYLSVKFNQAKLVPHQGKSQILRRVHNKKAGVHTRVSTHHPNPCVARCVFIEGDFTPMPPLTRLPVRTPLRALSTSTRKSCRTARNGHHHRNQRPVLW